MTLIKPVREKLAYRPLLGTEPAPLRQPPSTLAHGIFLKVDLAFLERCHHTASPHAIYPPLERFARAFGGEALLASLQGAAGVGLPRYALSLRVPELGRAARRAGLAPTRVLRHIADEVALYRAHLPSDARFEGLHWSCGALDGFQAASLMLACSHFELPSDAERSATLQPSAGSEHTIDALARLGFRRIEVDPYADAGGAGTAPYETRHPPRNAVFQRFEQSLIDTRISTLVTRAHREPFDSIGAGFVYAVPGQPRAALFERLDALLGAGPSHVTLYDAADLDAGRASTEDAGPASWSAHESTSLLLALVERLKEAGYVCVGRDLYALEQDPLCTAHRHGRLLREAHGLTTRPVSTVLSLGIGAIGHSAGSSYQNHGDIERYCACLANARLPVLRGTLLSPDDLARRAVMQSLCWNFFLDPAAIEAAHGLDFAHYFAFELRQLQPFAQAGLLSLDAALIELSEAGRLAAGAIARVFDRYARGA